MSLPLVNLHRALVERLSAHLSVPVLDHVPEKQEYPFLVVRLRTGGIGEQTGTEHIYEIQVFSAYAGSLELLTLLEDAAAILCAEPLAIADGFETHRPRFIQYATDEFVDQEKLIRVGLLTLANIVSE